jgi:penicillin-binding protein 2
MRRAIFDRFLIVTINLLLVTIGFAATQSKKRRATARKPAVTIATKSTATALRKPVSSPTVRRSKSSPRSPSSRIRRIRRAYSPWSEPTFADSTIGDVIEGEDPVVRRAAVDALGPYNGSVVVVDPNTGRVLSMVNQRLALKSGFQPCSIIKVPVAMAALVEGIIEHNTVMRVYGRKRLTLTEALARSDNPFFANLGNKLGFDRFSHYARLFGLGEKAGLDIVGEQPGVFPNEPPRNVDLGIMTSFGEGISLTPLQLAAMLSAIANGGTLYYLQYPRSAEEALNLIPRVKRHLDIESWIPEIRPGMMAAVEYGTARRANYDPSEPILGKTGTCTDARTHMGWFGSFNDVGRNKLTVVVMLTGGRGVNGPTAAEIAGNVYRHLSQQEFFAHAREISPTALVGAGSCCGQ